MLHDKFEMIIWWEVEFVWSAKKNKNELREQFNKGMQY